MAIACESDIKKIPLKIILLLEINLNTLQFLLSNSINLAHAQSKLHAIYLFIFQPWPRYFSGRSLAPTSLDLKIYLLRFVDGRQRTIKRTAGKYYNFIFEERRTRDLHSSVLVTQPYREISLTVPPHAQKSFHAHQPSKISEPLLNSSSRALVILCNFSPFLLPSQSISMAPIYKGFKYAYFWQAVYFALVFTLVTSEPLSWVCLSTHFHGLSLELSASISIDAKS